MLLLVELTLEQTFVNELETDFELEVFKIFKSI